MILLLIVYVIAKRGLVDKETFTELAISKASIKTIHLAHSLGLLQWTPAETEACARIRFWDGASFGLRLDEDWKSLNDLPEVKEEEEKEKEEEEKEKQKEEKGKEKEKEKEKEKLPELPKIRHSDEVKYEIAESMMLSHGEHYKFVIEHKDFFEHLFDSKERVNRLNEVYANSSNIPSCEHHYCCSWCLLIHHVQLWTNRIGYPALRAIIASTDIRIDYLWLFGECKKSFNEDILAALQLKMEAEKERVEKEKADGKYVEEKETVGYPPIWKLDFVWNEAALSYYLSRRQLWGALWAFNFLKLSDNAPPGTPHPKSNGFRFPLFHFDI